MIKIRYAIEDPMRRVTEFKIHCTTCGQNNVVEISDYSMMLARNWALVVPQITCPTCAATPPPTPITGRLIDKDDLE